MYPLLRSALFTLPPETAHHFSLQCLSWGHRLGMLPLLGSRPRPTPVRVMGLEFPNPVGLAAGLDKNAAHVDALGALGFGFIEVGTVTPCAQPGNPKPRLFRLPAQRALINRLGFNNLGVDHLVEQVAKRRFTGILGINIGKNFATPLAAASADYLLGMARVYRQADYITVNISSPNTPGLRALQDRAALTGLLAALRDGRNRLADQQGRRVPLAVKIAPDLDRDALLAIAELLVAHGIDAVIATNTTLDRTGIDGAVHAAEAGGLSGAPLRAKSTQVIATLATALAGALPIIGVGGVMHGQDAAEKIAAGASLVQIYTGFIYCGPKLVGEAVDAIASTDRFQSLVKGSLGGVSPEVNQKRVD